VQYLVKKKYYRRQKKNKISQNILRIFFEPFFLIE